MADMEAEAARSESWRTRCAASEPGLPACESAASDAGSDDEPATGANDGEAIEDGENDDGEDGKEMGEPPGEAHRDHPYPVSWLLHEKHARIGCGTLNKSVSCPDTVLHGKHACMASCKHTSK